MASERLETTWRHLRSLLGAAVRAETADAQLLARFVAKREDAAFAELVRRHGPLVYGVCRRVLPIAHDAEDAFQATFLILSRKAASIRRGESLACWLHHVALHVAVRLKRSIRSRKDRTSLPSDVPQPETDDVSWREVQRLLDEELARLPEHFRQPLILCYLEGKTRDEAADELGWSHTTFRGRLERARERLRWRLEKRGLTLSAALLAILAARNAEAATFSITTASARAATLATEVMRTMFFSKMKIALLWCIAVLFLSVGVGTTAYRCLGVEPGAPPQTKAPPTPTKPPTPPEEDGVVKDFKAHLDQFRLTITLRPQERENLETRYPVSDLRLHVSSGPIGEPGGKGTVFARITKEQAAKIVDLLAKDNFFRDSVADWERLKPPKGDYVELWTSYRNGEEPQSVKRLHTLAWDAHLIEQLKAIRACVDGEAAKSLDKMIASLQAKPVNGELLKIISVEDLDRVFVGTDEKDLELWVELDGVLPFKAWPDGLTRAQQELRKEGHKLAHQWLLKQTVEFHLTRAPKCGDLIRYTTGPTKVVQEWKGQMPSELYAKDAFHVNVLLIQEGYSPFVHNPQSKWDKKTLTCYESAEQYAMLHKKGIWSDPEFAERLKKIAEKWEGRKDASTHVERLEQMVARTPDSMKAIQLRYELAELYRQLVDKQERVLLDASTDDTEKRRALLTEVRDHYRKRAAEEFENLVTTLEKPDSADYLSARDKRDSYYFAALMQFQMGQYDKALAAYERMAKRYHNEADYWTAVAGMVSSYTGKGDVEMVRKGVNEIRAGLPTMDAEMRKSMEQYLRDVEKALPEPRK